VSSIRLRLLGFLSLAICMAAIASSLWSQTRCGSVGFKTSSGIGYRIYLTHGQLVFARTQDVVVIFRGPRQGLFPRPQGFFTFNFDNVAQASAPDLFLRTERSEVPSALLAQWGFQIGGYECAWRDGGPEGGFNLPPFPRQDMDSYAVPIWFPPLLIMLLAVT
jgi:hypothetical protein